ncbi:NB-ARC domain-containing protein [Streptomyces olivaceiscleroticus]|uniref:AAA+ ATPase domain-containing protein n=1 Tax=Streptomyces olivaceiscleroticus TaxID=68245 RepID=A0ABP3KRH5_9ACTN
MSQVLQPGKAHTMDEFIAELRLLKAWAGNPSITEITRRVHTAWQRAGRPRSEWPARSTVGNCFQLGRRRPNSDLLLAVVHALVGGDAASFAAWRLALHTVLGEAEASSRATAADRLPDLPAHHVTRRPLLKEAARLLDGGAHPTLVLHGMAGTGKTVLALALGHQLRTATPQPGPILYADLHGRDDEAPATDPAAVLDTFLRLLGVTGDRVPRGLAPRAALFHQLLDRRRALVVLDDAADEEQLRPLLPHDSTCRTLVTSRHDLRGIDDVHRLHVPAFTPQEAADLLHRTAGPDRLHAHPDDVRRITRTLGCHPLALTVIGRHLRDHPAWAPADYLKEPLTMLAMEGGLRAALARSTARLDAGAHHLLRLLVLHPCRDIDVPTTAALLGATADTATQHLAALAAEHLMEASAPGRFRMPALVRAYAEQRLGIDEPASAISRAAQRLEFHLTAESLSLIGPAGPAETTVPRNAGRMPTSGRRPRTVRRAEPWQRDLPVRAAAPSPQPA